MKVVADASIFALSGMYSKGSYIVSPGSDNVLAAAIAAEHSGVAR